MVSKLTGVVRSPAAEALSCPRLGDLRPCRQRVTPQSKRRCVAVGKDRNNPDRSRGTRGDAVPEVVRHHPSHRPGSAIRAFVPSTAMSSGGRTMAVTSFPGGPCRLVDACSTLFALLGREISHRHRCPPSGRVRANVSTTTWGSPPRGNAPSGPQRRIAEAAEVGRDSVDAGHLPVSSTMRPRRSPSGQPARLRQRQDGGPFRKPAERPSHRSGGGREEPVHYRRRSSAPAMNSIDKPHQYQPKQAPN